MWKWNYLLFINWSLSYAARINVYNGHRCVTYTLMILWDSAFVVQQHKNSEWLRHIERWMKKMVCITHYNMQNTAIVAHKLMQLFWILSFNISIIIPFKRLLRKLKWLRLHYCLSSALHIQRHIVLSISNSQNGSCSKQFAAMENGANAGRIQINFQNESGID